MSQDESVNVLDTETRNIRTTMEKHWHEIELFTGIQNVFLSGFSSIPTFEYKDESEYIWLLMLIRAFNSVRCSIDLMLKGYYSQSMSIIRTITEGYFVCGTARDNEKVRDCLLRDSEMPKYSKLAAEMKASSIYRNDYHYQSKFTHSTRLSLRVLYDLDRKVAKVAPSYDETLFLLCTESLMRASICMFEVFANLLTNLDKVRAQSWSEDNIAKRDSVINWLGELRGKYGGDIEE